MGKRPRDYYLDKMDILRGQRGYQCQVIDKGNRCPVKDELQFAHIKPTGISGRGRGLAVRYHDIKNNPECYMLMCKWHHKKFDREYWKNQAAV